MRYSNSRMMNVPIVLKTQNVSSSENVHISFVSNVSIKMINVLYVNYFREVERLYHTIRTMTEISMSSATQMFQPKSRPMRIFKTCSTWEYLSLCDFSWVFIFLTPTSCKLFLIDPFSFMNILSKCDSLFKMSTNRKLSQSHLDIISYGIPSSVEFTILYFFSGIFCEATCKAW